MPLPTRNSGPQPLIQSHPLKAIFLLSLAVPLYFLLLGYFGDDYGFHLSSWIGMAEDWRSGVLAPSWFAPANFGLGEPRFYFYPPLSVVCGAFFLSIFPAHIVPALMPWLAVVIAGMSMLKLARSLHPERATQSALLYCTSFYLVITILMRYAIAEVFVAAILPLIILYIVRLLTDHRQVISLPLIALLAFAWLTNIPAALVIFYVLLFGSAFLSATQRSLRPMCLYLIAQALAVGLSAWYLIPAALAHTQLTSTSLASKFPWRDYTLFHHPHNPLARSLTWPLWIWAIAGFVFVLYAAVKQDRAIKFRPQFISPWTFIAALGCVPLLFEIPQGDLLWNGLPALKLVAFSFRFLPFLAIALALLLPRIRTTSLRRSAYLLWIVWMLLPVAERIGRYHVHGAPESFAAVVAAIGPSTAGMSEYLPVGINTSPESATVIASSNLGASVCTTTPLRWKPQDRQVESHSSQPCLYEPGLFFFPEWLATVDNQPVPVQRSVTGQVQIQVPAGEHHVEVFFQRPRKPLLLSAGTTLFTILLLFAASRHLTKFDLDPPCSKTTPSVPDAASMT